MINRIIIAIVLVILTLLIYYLGGIPLLIFTNLVIIFGMSEFYKMLSYGNKKYNKYLGYFFGLIIPNGYYLQKMGYINFKHGTALFVVGIIILLTYRVLRNQIQNTSEYFMNTLLPVIYVSFMFSHILAISFLVEGKLWLITIQTLVWISDTFAYIVGMNIGRKFFKKGLSVISPKKSIEGSIGSIIFTIITMFLINIVFFDGIKIIHLIIIPVIVSFFGQIGDLVESIFKREYEIKDSGHILGEHGGILDRYDSLIFVLPLMYYYIKFFIV
ncbi:phosphatidate cytidylyltransferase [Hypnocyclicus thermotrophus]|uniref:Phosphatidate cytidylyltransferase n=1 Tax=Hypnocyclicus thermotrophus TaxID=1627895 RepID=A0AA46DYU8_9FUSO|nr:phosphatidate cytidylyltransferase [Hypnocyclicus thermotrophus]TDT70648.1 phosphatidate cytidylyltransferase [Hypnocyclicus thermotrophus]